VEVRDPHVCAKPVLLSIYSYNDQMLKVIQEAIPFLGPGAAPVARALAGRLLVFGGYLHSDFSSTLRLVLERDGDGRDRLVLSHEINPLAAAIAQHAVRALARLWRPLRGVPVLPMLRVKDPGTAYHFGGSFPMTSRPLRSFESDPLRAAPGFRRGVSHRRTELAAASRLDHYLQCHGQRVSHCARFDSGKPGVTGPLPMIAVTGATGYLGSALVQYLLSRGHGVV